MQLARLRVFAASHAWVSPAEMTAGGWRDEANIHFLRVRSAGDMWQARVALPPATRISPSPQPGALVGWGLHRG